MHTLRKVAEDLKELFRKPPCPSSAGGYSSDTIQSELIELEELNSLIRCQDELPTSHSDVAVILGHANTYNFGSLTIADILEALLHPKPPSFVVFLGCCGGNVRYGPLAMLSQIPEYQDTVFSFFQRRIYIDELFHSAPVLAVQYYVHLISQFQSTQDKIACSIRDAKSDSAFEKDAHAALFLNATFNRSLGSECDLALFSNSSFFPTTQELIHVFTGVFGSVYEIPLSCWQLAMYHTFTAKNFEEQNIKKLIDKKLGSIIKQPTQHTNEEVKAVVKKECKGIMKYLKLDEINELACELQLLQVSKATVFFLKSRRWKKVDHLQFFVALLHGHWERSSYDDIREWATYHLRKCREGIETSIDPTNIYAKNLHKYRLCCVGYCLFSPDSYIEFPSNSSGKLGIKYSNLVTWETIVTPGVYYIDVVDDQKLKLPIEAMPAGSSCEYELPWENFFKHCPSIDDFVDLYNHFFGVSAMPQSVFIHNLRFDECNCYVDFTYEYSSDVFILALDALKRLHHLFPPLCEDEDVLKNDPSNLHRIKVFHNRKDQRKGHIKSFPFVQPPVYYVEMRIIFDYKVVKTKFDYLVHNFLESLKTIGLNPHFLREYVLTHNERVKDMLLEEYVIHWKHISRCRFVFAYNVREDNVKAGMLYFTDSHYGWDFIEERKINNIVKDTCTLAMDLSYFDKLKVLPKAAIHDLQETVMKKFEQEGQDIFPYKNIGWLELTQDSFHLYRRN